MLLDKGIEKRNIHADCTSAIKEIKNRPAFSNLLLLLKKDDTLYVSRLDRFSRSLLDGITTISELNKKGLNLISLDSPVINDLET
jgi:DNA invertase Pin-like site-specific DNA recombinase